MAKQRYISTGFWNDRWVRTLTPNQRYLYMYLLTNPETTIAGIYKILRDRIVFDTGIDEKTLEGAFKVFEEASKAYHFDGEWVVIPSWPRHQKVTEKNNIRTGIDNVLMELPEPVWSFINQIDYQYSFMKGLARGFKEPVRDSNYSDLNLDSDLDSNSDIKSDAPAVSDPVMIAYRTGIEVHLPAAAWPGTYKQHAALSELVAKTHELAPESAIPDPCEFATAVLASFESMKAEGKGEYWSKASWEPVTVLRRFGELVTDLSDVHDQSSRAEEEVEFMRRFHGEAN